MTNEIQTAQAAIRAMAEIVAGSRQQCDEDGTMIAVSRQALEELLTIIAAIRALTSAESDPIGWVYQHEDTGRMTFCENDGINTPEVFQRLNPRHILCGPAYTTPPVVEVTEAMARVLTCVYCGHEYSQDTPASGDKVLTDHIRTCSKHPLRQAEATIATLHAALVGLVGASNPEELRSMEAMMRVLPADDDDKAVTINAIQVLLATHPRALTAALKEAT